MEWLFENIGPTVFFFLFVLPLIKKIIQRRKEEGRRKNPRPSGAKAVTQGKTERSGENILRHSLEEKPPRQDIPKERPPQPAPPPPSLTAKSRFPDLKMPSAESDGYFDSFPPQEEDAFLAYRRQEPSPPRRKIALLPPLKRAIIWKEILDPPRGLHPGQSGDGFLP